MNVRRVIKKLSTECECPGIFIGVGYSLSCVFNIALCMFFVVWGVSCGGSTSGTTTAPSTRTIQGVIIDDFDNPVGGMVLQLGQDTSMVTNENGEFAFTTTEQRSTYVVTVQSEFFSSIVEIDDIAESVTRVDLVIRIDEAEQVVEIVDIQVSEEGEIPTSNPTSTSTVVVTPSGTPASTPVATSTAQSSGTPVATSTRPARTTPTTTPTQTGPVATATATAAASATATVTTTMTVVATPTATVTMSSTAVPTMTSTTTPTSTPSPAEGLDPDLLYYYSFDEGSGATTSDETGNATDATITNATWTTGQVGSALRFSGNAVVNLGRLSPPAGPLSITSWVNFNSLVEPDARIISKAGSVLAPQHDWMLSTSTDNEEGLGDRFIRVRFRGSGRTWEVIVDDIPLQTGRWYHVAAVYDENSFFVYLDGNQVASHSRIAGPVSDRGFEVTVGDNPDGERALDGIVDEIKIFTSVLSGAEVRAEYNRRE